jgi:hypothetical protein
MLLDGQPKCPIVTCTGCDTARGPHRPSAILFDLVDDVLCGDRAFEAMLKQTFGVDQEGGRQHSHLAISCQRIFAVLEDRKSDAEAFDKLYDTGFVVVFEGDSPQMSRILILLVKALEFGEFLEAGRAPGCPEVDHQPFAALLRGFVQSFCFAGKSVPVPGAP